MKNMWTMLTIVNISQRSSSKIRPLTTMESTIKVGMQIVLNVQSMQKAGKNSRTFIHPLFYESRRLEVHLLNGKIIFCQHWLA